MGTILVSSKTRQAGKTALVAALGHYFRDAGKTVSLANLGLEQNDDFEIQHLSPQLEGCNFIASNTKSLKIDLKRPAQELVLIEGATDNHKNNKAIADDLDATVILILQYGETIDDLSELYHDRIGGVIINNVPKYKEWEFENVGKSDHYADLPIIGFLPESRSLLAPDFKSIVETLQGDYVINQNKADCLIENYLIGGLVLDWGPDYFRLYPNSCVIVRGDRPDLQLAALQTEEVKAMLLTKTDKPIEYVYYEARQQGVPLATVSGSTTDVAGSLSNVAVPNRFNHPQKLNCMVRLLHEHIDMTAIDKFALQFATH